MFIIMVGNKAKDMFDYNETWCDTHEKGYLPFIRKPKPEELLQRVPYYPTYIKDDKYCFMLHDDKYIRLLDFIKGYGIKPENKGDLGIDEAYYSDRLEELVESLSKYPELFYDWVIMEASDGEEVIEGKEHFLEKLKELGEEGRYFNISDKDLMKVHYNFVSSLIDIQAARITRMLGKAKKDIRNELNEAKRNKKNKKRGLIFKETTDNNKERDDI